MNEGILRLKVDRERVRTQLTIGELLGLDMGDMLKARLALAKFVVGESEQYAATDEGLAAVDALSIEAFGKEVVRLRKGIHEALVNP